MIKIRTTSAEREGPKERDRERERERERKRMKLRLKKFNISKSNIYDLSLRSQSVAWGPIKPLFID